jgi:ribosomal protein S18 acetylase RimI-like enzyme
MHFELDNALIDSILFSMEDQNFSFLIDTHEAEVVSTEDAEDEIDADDDERYIGLPEWDSNDGFRLMERFAVSFKNPPVKKALSRALDQGRGVFRAFKNVLNEYPEAEQLWYKYKEREMRKHIVRWYNALREEWGLEKIGEEPEETDDLILEDFRIRHPRDEDAIEAMKLHQFCQEEHEKMLSINVQKNHANDWDFPRDISWVAENNNGDFTAYILAKTEDSYIKIIALEVLPEYRGMGLGEILLNHFIAHLDKKQFSHILIDVPIQSESFSKVLFREGFLSYETKYCLKTKLDKNDV